MDVTPDDLPDPTTNTGPFRTEEWMHNRGLSSVVHNRSNPCMTADTLSINSRSLVLSSHASPCHSRQPLRREWNTDAGRGGDMEVDDSDSDNSVPWSPGMPSSKEATGVSINVTTRSSLHSITTAGENFDKPLNGKAGESFFSPVPFLLLGACLVTCTAAFSAAYLLPSSDCNDGITDAVLADFTAAAAVVNTTGAARVTYTLSELRDRLTSRSAEETWSLVLPVLSLVFLVVVAGGLAVVIGKATSQKAASEKAEKERNAFFDLLPVSISASIHRNDPCVARYHADLTFCYTEIVGVAKYASQLSPHRLVIALNSIVAAFDELAADHKVFKVKATGDTYMCVCGIEAYEDHVITVVQWAQSVLEEMQNPKYSMSEKGHKLDLRFGVSTGPAVSGIVGGFKPAYDFWGDTVNMATRMESAGKTNRLNCTFEVYEKLKRTAPDDFEWETQRDVFVEGKGKMDTYLIVGNNQGTRDLAQRRQESVTDTLTDQLVQAQCNVSYQSELQQVLRGVTNLTEELELSKAAVQVVLAVQDLLACDRATLFIVDEASRMLWSYNTIPNGQKICVPMNNSLVGFSATSGEIVNIKDTYTDYRFNRSVDVQTGYKTCSLLCFPVKRDGLTVAVIQAVNKKVGVFTAQDEVMISLIGRQVGIQLAHGFVYEKLKQSEAKQQILFNVSRDLNLGANAAIDQLFELVAAGSRRIVECERVSLFLVDDERKNLFSLATSSTGECETICMPLGIGIVGRVALTGEAMNVADVRSCMYWDSSTDEKTGYQTRGVMAVPVVDPHAEGAQKVIGVIQVVNKVKAPSDLSYSGTDPALLVTAADEGSSKANTAENVSPSEPPFPIYPPPPPPPAAGQRRTSRVVAMPPVQEPADSVPVAWPQFDLQDQVYLQAFASFLALSVRNFQLHDADRQKRDMLRLLLRMSLFSGTVGSLTEMIVLFQDQIPLIANCEACQLFLTTESEDKHVSLMTVAKGETVVVELDASEPESLGLVGRVACNVIKRHNTTEQGVRNPLFRDPSYRDDIDNKMGCAVQNTSLIVQLLNGETVLGVLQVVNKRGNGAFAGRGAADAFPMFDQADIDMLTQVAVVAAAIVLQQRDRELTQSKQSKYRKSGGSRGLLNALSAESLSSLRFLKAQ
ncbi:Dual 3prime [Diplonema papillatum]|nr:Dual 3prime [Diplonema papillatum]